jgi:hypothetical protein
MQEDDHTDGGRTHASGCIHLGCPLARGIRSREVFNAEYAKDIKVSIGEPRCRALQFTPVSIGEDPNRGGASVRAVRVGG